MIVLPFPSHSLLSNLQHPCFNHLAHQKFGRVHLPVALKCNIRCNFCDRRISVYYHAARPGISGKILSPIEALGIVEKVFEKFSNISIVGIAGPGEPLFNDETFETMELIREQFPEATLCVCTNGLLLSDNVSRLKKLGVRYLTITINAVDPRITQKINSWTYFEEKRYTGLEAAKILTNNQLDGLKLAADHGFLIKVNTVLIPKINDDHVVAIARKISELGAKLHNIIPLIPLSKFRGLAPPTCNELNEIRETCEFFIPQFRLCKQCRADVCGVPGLEDTSLNNLEKA